jgi:diadenosine tetraphosphate (Ap4A) HIT family hydrolase
MSLVRSIMASSVVRSVADSSPCHSSFLVNGLVKADLSCRQAQISARFFRHASSFANAPIAALASAGRQGYGPASFRPEPMPEADFTLHPQLARDTLPLGDLPLSRVLLIDDATYPWLLLVPRRQGVTEITDLGSVERAHLMSEITEVADAVKAETGCDKLNIAALGNVVPQLHVHIIARFRSDAAWPRPVWGQVPPSPYGEAERAAAVARYRRRIWLEP